MSSSVDTMFRLDGKVAIVTGASRGIGEAIARSYAALGAKVVVVARKPEGVQAVVDAIHAAGGAAIGLPSHLGRPEDVQALVPQVLDAFGRIDILVNNAATNPTFGPTLYTEVSVFDKIMDVNVKGPFLLANAVQPIMAEQKSGSIINMSSMAGISPEPGLGIYSVSKAALISLTKVQAKEWGPVGIRANAVCPGLIKTKFSRALWESDEILKRTLEQQALPRLGEPEDVVGLCVFLASDASSYCTGGVYTVDGGYTI